MLYGVKKLFADEHRPWWRVYVIRNRQFGRRLVEPVIDSANLTKRNKSEIELVDSDVFLMHGPRVTIVSVQRPSNGDHRLLPYRTRR